MEEIGARMRDRRTYLGLNQQDVADKISKERSSYAQYETGKNEPSAETLAKIAEVLRVPVGYLFGEVERIQVEEDEFLQFYNGRPPVQKEQARRVLQALFASQDAEAKALDRDETTYGKQAE